MAYDLTALAELVYRRVRQQPTARLTGISCALGVDRHTLAKALKHRYGVSYRNLQRQILLEELEAHIEGQPAETTKALGFAFGYQHPQSFSRRVRQLTRATVSQFRLKRI
jgi:methylphosphotriester-DNA--protein-cysteine methyltransferase